MTDVSIDEPLVFGGYPRRRSSGPHARGVQRVLNLAPGCTTADQVLALLGHDEPGDVRDCAIEFIQQFRVPVREDVIDAIVSTRRSRDTRLPVDPETEQLASDASYKEFFLAALIIEADIRDVVTALVSISTPRTKPTANHPSLGSAATEADPSLARKSRPAGQL